METEDIQPTPQQGAPAPVARNDVAADDADQLDKVEEPAPKAEPHENEPPKDEPKSPAKSEEDQKQNLPEVKPVSAAMASVCSSSKLDEIDQKIADLQGLRDTLATLVESCHGDDRPDCPILDDLSGG